MMKILIFSICLLHNFLVNGAYYNEYSDRYARQMVVVAAGAHALDPMKCLNLVLPQDNYRLVTHKITACDSKGNTCAVYTAVSPSAQKIIVAFRGTVGTEQFKFEYSELLKPGKDWYGYGLIGRYWYNAIEKMWPYVLPVLNETSSQHFEVQFVGYSLGGALSVLAAMRTHALGLRKNEKIKLLTFGEPRVGNSIFATNVDRVINDVYRVVHRIDAVPHLPPCRESKLDSRACDRSDLTKLYHHGTEVWYNNDMSPGANYQICSREDEDVTCSSSMKDQGFDAKDHLNYFGWDVGAYGGSNCTSNVRPPPKSARGSLSLLGLMLVPLLTIIF